MSAMSAIEQPALRSGRMTRWWSAVRTSADSAMKCTPQKTMSVAWSLSAANYRGCRIQTREWGMVARPEPGSIPDAPGSYQFVDTEGRVTYVGKAKSLRSRLSNYFAPPATLPERTYQMVQTAERVEWIVA